MKWTRKAPGLYRSADGLWKVERSAKGNGYGGKSWHLFGPDSETGEEIYYCTQPTKNEAQYVAGKESENLSKA